jgi:Xaa-Pro aminopeptidase
MATLSLKTNCEIIREGDLVLIDSGIGYEGYVSDITRTFPATGRFTPRQRELYEIVLEAQEAAIATMRPGSNSLEAHQASVDVLKRYGLDKYGYGNAGHPVGLNIHDPNSAGWDNDQPFEPGVVIAIEPFISIPEEGVGIRNEDGVLITATGHELMPGPAREAVDVEALCSNAVTQVSKSGD